jgi:hypothetical protein
MRGCAAGCAVGGANIAPPAHPSPPAPGRGGPPPTASRDSAAVSHHPPCLAGAVTLSDENARSRFRACVQARSRRPAARSGPLTGPARGLRADALPTLEPMGDLRRPLAYPLASRTTHSCWLCPSWGQSAATTAPDWPPYGGVERTDRADALRAIDSSACPRSWRTCGPRRLRRQSQPDLVAT